LGKRGRPRECKENGSRIQEKDECRSEVTREIKYSREKKL